MAVALMFIGGIGMEMGGRVGEEDARLSLFCDCTQRVRIPDV